MRAFEKRQCGFTLVEMIIVIVITGIIAGIVAIFIKAPVQGYLDSARRAELTDIADTAVRRLSRDVRTAVPNSLIVTGACPVCKVEFLPTKDGGRYRADLPGDTLVFDGTDKTFDVVSPAKAVAGDSVVIGSTSSSGALAYDTTAAGSLRSVTAAVGGAVTTNITLNAGLPVTASLQSQRFDLVDGTQMAVTYACEGAGTDASGNGTGRLVRYWGYGFTHTLGATKSILADKLSDCLIDYGLPNQRLGVLAVRLAFASSGESVSLYNEIHVNNSP